MQVMYGKDTPVEVYNFDGDEWLAATVVEPEEEIGGYDYLHVKLRKSGVSVWVAPELVGRHVRMVVGR